MSAKGYNLYPMIDPAKITTYPQLPPLHTLGDAITDVQLTSIYDNLVQQTRTAMRRANFSKFAVGLSGGLDSALVSCIAVDALALDDISPDAALGVIMPSAWTPASSLRDAQQIAHNLRMSSTVIDIMPSYDAITQTLAPVFADASNTKGESDHTFSNIQARIRGLMLMAISNRQQHFVLCPSNLSETSVGYTTLYGDMVGSFAPIAPLYKSWVFELAQYRNQRAREQEMTQPIPQSVIDKEPSAEFDHGQIDADELGPYHYLDALLHAYFGIEGNDCDILKVLVQQGFDRDYALAIIDRIKGSSFKRQQACPGAILP